MLDRAFAVVSDEAYFPGLWALLNSIWAYHGTSVTTFVFLQDVPPQACYRHPLFISGVLSVHRMSDLPSETVGTWEAKQRVPSFLAGIARTVMLLDADCVLVSKMDDVFERADKGLIVASEDGGSSVDYTRIEFNSYGENWQAESMPYFTSGILAFDVVRHWDLAALWEFTSRFAAYSPSGGEPYRFHGHGDQGTLNACAARLGKNTKLSLLPQELWGKASGWKKDRDGLLMLESSPVVVQNVRENEPQRIVHCTGPKWWTDRGRRELPPSVLDVFRYFHELDAQSQAA